jgi:uncharacterized protein (DUF4415 family)
MGTDSGKTPGWHPAHSGRLSLRSTRTALSSSGDRAGDGEGVELPAFTYYDLGMGSRMIKGQPVSDEQIQVWADEAEAGYPVELLRKRGRQPLGDGPSTVVPVRLDADLLEALGARAEAEHVTRSEAIRAAIRAWLGAA